jgi:hypothetical protein
LNGTRVTMVVHAGALGGAPGRVSTLEGGQRAGGADAGGQESASTVDGGRGPRENDWVPEGCKDGGGWWMVDDGWWMDASLLFGTWAHGVRSFVDLRTGADGPGNNA